MTVPTTIDSMEIAVVGAEQADLVFGVPPARLADALEATRAVTLRVNRGPWAAEELHAPAGHLGLLVLDGLLFREVRVGRRSYVELLGRGDILRPWQPPGGEHADTAPTRWIAETDVRLAVLDRTFAARVGPFPEVVAALMGRLLRRSRWLAFQLAVAHVPQLEVRLRLVLWYLGDRWGRATPDGVVLPLHLSHEVLGALAGGHRAAVTRALGRLRASGEVFRRPDGAWLLCGPPPVELGHVLLSGEGGAPQGGPV